MSLSQTLVTESDAAATSQLRLSNHVTAGGGTSTDEIGEQARNQRNYRRIIGAGMREKIIPEGHYGQRNARLTTGWSANWTTLVF